MLDLIEATRELERWQYGEVDFGYDDVVRMIGGFMELRLDEDATILIADCLDDMTNAGMFPNARALVLAAYAMIYVLDAKDS